MSNNSILLLWASRRIVPETLYLIAVYGYTYVDILLVWVKLTAGGDPKLGLGWWTRSNVEFILIAWKGKGCLAWRGDGKNIP